MKLIMNDDDYKLIVNGLMGATPTVVHFVYFLELRCDTLQSDQPLPEEYLLCFKVGIHPGMAEIAIIQFRGAKYFVSTFLKNNQSPVFLRC